MANETTQQLKDVIMQRYDAADRWLELKRVAWAEYEDIRHSKLGDSISGKTGSQVFDPILSTLSMDRAHRVMAQLATGKVRNMSRNDEGSAALMNLAVDKYVIPNATAQFDFLTKCRMVDDLSNTYGGFGVLLDWDVKPNGYIGPDMWLIPIRDIFPQVGAMSVEDSDFVIIRSWKSLSFFEGLKDNPDYKNIDDIIIKLKEKADSKQSRDSKQMSQRELQAYPTGSPAKGDGFFEVLSMYERDRWVDFCVDAELEFRDRPNPHENGELPVVWKYSIPMIDDIIGMGDYERGKTMQWTANSLWNLYLEGVRVSIFPPVMFNKDAIADKSSIKWTQAARWMLKGNPAAAAQVLNLTPQGIQTFNNTMTAVKTSLLRQFGDTDTSVTQQQDPGFGRTPEALKQQNAKMSARDSADRFYMEQFVSKVIRKMVNLMSKKSDKIQFRMFADEIRELGVEYPEIKEMYDEKTGKLTIDKKTTGNMVYDYEIVSGSTYATDQKEQQQTLVELFKMITEKLDVNPQTGEASSPILNVLKAEGKDISLGEMMTRIIANSGVQDWDKIIMDKGSAGGAQDILDNHMQKFQAALMALGGANQVPATPDGGMPPVMPAANGQGGPAQPMPQMPPQQPQMPPQMPQGPQGPSGQPLPPEMQGGPVG